MRRRLGHSVCQFLDRYEYRCNYELRERICDDLVLPLEVDFYQRLVHLGRNWTMCGKESQSRAGLLYGESIHKPLLRNRCIRPVVNAHTYLRVGKRILRLA